MDSITEPQTVKVQANGLTIELDLHQLLTAIDPQGRWTGYNPDTDEDNFEPSSLTDQIALITSNQLVKVMRKEVKDMISASVVEVIDAEVTSIVREYIQGTEVQKTDGWGNPTGAPLPLTKMITDAVAKMNKTTNYDRGPSPLQKMVDESVNRAFKAELTEAVKTARAAALKAVQDNAATVIRETIERSTRGL